MKDVRDGILCTPTDAVGDLEWNDDVRDGEAGVILDESLTDVHD